MAENNERIAQTNLHVVSGGPLVIEECNLCKDYRNKEISDVLLIRQGGISKKNKSSFRVVLIVVHG